MALAKPLALYHGCTNTFDSNKNLAIVSAYIWKKNLGMDVKLIKQEWKIFLDSRHKGKI
jgi:oligopeptide transport system substrate-binding protein